MNEFNNEPKLINLENTRFIFNTNFSGDPANDRFGSPERKGNIVINDIDLAKDMIDAGFNVKQTRPREDVDPEDFVPTYYIPVKLGYRNRFGELKPERHQPKVYLWNDDMPEKVLLHEENVGMIDNIDVKSVDVSLNPNDWERNGDSGKTLWVRTMYVTQNLDDDPFASKYRRSSSINVDEEEAF